MPNTIVKSLSSGNKISNPNNIDRMSSSSSITLSTFIKPAIAAGTIYGIEKFVIGNRNDREIMFLAGGIGASFFAAKLIAPYVPNFSLGMSNFNSAALENRIVEVGLTTGALIGMQKGNLITLPASGDRNGLVMLAGKVFIADLISEELLPFLGDDAGVGHH